MLATDEMVNAAILDVRAALGRAPADLVLRNCQLVNVCSEEIHRASLAIRGKRIVAIRENYEGRGVNEIDCSNLYAMPGAIEPYFEPVSDAPSAAALIARGVTAVASLPGVDLHEFAQAGIRCLEIGSVAQPIQPGCICARADEALHHLRQGTTVVLDCGPTLAAWRRTFGDLQSGRIDSGRFLIRNFAGSFEIGRGPLQEAIATGIAPARAQQLTSFNAAIHFALDHEIGSLTPGRYADIILAREPCGRPEMVVLNGDLRRMPGDS